MSNSFSLCMVRKYNPEIKLIYIGKQFIASILKPILVSKTFYLKEVIQDNLM